MTKEEALKLALEALDSDNPDIQLRAAIIIRGVLAQPEQEPVAWLWEPTGEVTTDPDRADGMWLPLYTAPPQRTWVGLTDEDKQTAFDATQEGGGFWEFADAIEAKLKEKNT